MVRARTRTLVALRARALLLDRRTSAANTGISEASRTRHHFANAKRAGLGGGASSGRHPGSRRPQNPRVGPEILTALSRQELNCDRERGYFFGFDIQIHPTDGMEVLTA